MTVIQTFTAQVGVGYDFRDFYKLLQVLDKRLETHSASTVLTTPSLMKLINGHYDLLVRKFVQLAVLWLQSESEVLNEMCTSLFKDLCPLFSSRDKSVADEEHRMIIQFLARRQVATFFGGFVCKNAVEAKFQKLTRAVKSNELAAKFLNAVWGFA